MTAYDRGPGSHLGRAYLAGPEVFLPDAATVGAAKQKICARRDIGSCYPLEAENQSSQGEIDPYELFEACRTMMDQCDLMIANLTPFRGASSDIGTAIECSYMYAQGKPVFGYTNEPDDYRVRVEALDLAQGCAVEDFGLCDNLMMEGLIRHSGGSLVRASVRQVGRVLTDLVAFDECVQLAERLLRASGTARATKVQ